VRPDDFAYLIPEKAAGRIGAKHEDAWSALFISAEFLFLIHPRHFTSCQLLSVSAFRGLRLSLFRSHRLLLIGSLNLSNSFRQNLDIISESI
jgi:hypothetical protein